MLNNIKYPTNYRKNHRWSWLDLLAFYTCMATFFIMLGYTWAYKAYSPQITELKQEVSRLEIKLFNTQIKKDFQNVITQ